MHWWDLSCLTVWQFRTYLRARAAQEESQVMQEVLESLQQAVLDFDTEQETLEEMRREFDNVVTQFLDRADDVIGAANGEVQEDESAKVCAFCAVISVSG